MNRLLLTFAAVVVLVAAFWAANGFPRLEAERPVLAGLFLIVATVLIWLRWDIAPELRRKRLEEQNKDNDPRA